MIRRVRIPTVSTLFAIFFISLAPLAQDVMYLSITIRDFYSSHDDFENPPCGSSMLTGMVERELGIDRKPVAAHDSPCPVAKIYEWFNDVQEINTRYCDTIVLSRTAQSADSFKLADGYFFPIDGVPTDVEPSYGEDLVSHNFHFCLEAHARFEYRGGEFFEFKGDDDVYVFINNQLAIDLGHIHTMERGAVSLDDSASMLQIQRGNFYNFDFFFCERQTNESNFFISTDMVLTPNPAADTQFVIIARPYIRQVRDTIFLYQNGIHDTLFAAQQYLNITNDGYLDGQLPPNVTFEDPVWDFGGVRVNGPYIIIDSDDLTIGAGKSLTFLERGIARATKIVVALPTPKLSPVRIFPRIGHFKDSIFIVLKSFEGASILYTLDGTDPRISTTVQEYRKYFKLTSTTTIKVFASHRNYISSDLTVEARYKDTSAYLLEFIDKKGTLVDTLFGGMEQINLRATSFNYGFRGIYGTDTVRFSYPDHETFLLSEGVLSYAYPMTVSMSKSFPFKVTSEIVPNNGLVEADEGNQIIASFSGSNRYPEYKPRDTVLVVPGLPVLRLQFMDSRNAIETLQETGPSPWFRIFADGQTVTDDALDSLPVWLSSDDGDSLTVFLFEMGNPAAGHYESAVIPFNFLPTVNTQDYVLDCQLDLGQAISQCVANAEILYPTIGIASQMLALRSRDLSGIPAVSTNLDIQSDRSVEVFTVNGKFVVAGDRKIVMPRLKKGLYIIRTTNEKPAKLRVKLD